MPEKRTSVVRSISKQLNKIASSTSNSDETTHDPKAIDDVSLSKTAKKAQSKQAKTSKSAVIGNNDLKLKVSHNDAGRIVISLSSPAKVLVQVHVDESVLKTKGSILKKKTKTSSAGTKKLKDDKDLPKKKSNSSLVKSSKKVTVKSTVKKKNISKKAEPRDLPDESTVRREKFRSKRGETSKFKAAHFSSMASVASSHCSDDDSTRSPLDLNRIAPRTPRVQKGLAPQLDTPSTEPDLDDFGAAPPTWDKRRQMMLKRQNSKDPIASPGAPNLTTALHDFMDTGTEAKVEETVEELSVFSSPLQQKRLQNRQKRLDRQRTETETFRSTRSIRSGASSHNDRPTTTLDPPSQELDASTNKTPDSFPPLMKEDKSVNSNNRATHFRHLAPHEDPDDDDDSATSNTNRRIRNTLEKVRKVQLTNKGDRKDGMEDSLLGGGTSKTGCNLFTKICDKVSKNCNKRHRKDKQKLDN